MKRVIANIGLYGNGSDNVINKEHANTNKTYRASSN